MRDNLLSNPELSESPSYPQGIDSYLASIPDEHREQVTGVFQEMYEHAQELEAARGEPLTEDDPLFSTQWRMTLPWINNLLNDQKAFESFVTKYADRYPEDSSSRKIIPSLPLPRIERQEPIADISMPLDEVEAILNSEEACATILQNKAERLAKSTAKHAIEGNEQTGAYELDDEASQELYDPELPTLVVDLCTGYRGSELTGQAAQILRARGEQSINIVYARCDTNGASLVTTNEQSVLRVTHGIMISKEGNVFFGKLPQPVHTKTVETTNVKLMVQCQERGIQTLNSVEKKNEFNEKGTIGEIAEEAGVKSPRRFALPLREEELSSCDYIVVKSSKETGGGKGVKRFNTMDNSLLHYVHFLQSYGYEPIVEEFIPNAPLSEPNPQTSSETTEKSWSVRYTIASGKLIGIYISVNSANIISNAMQGAKAYRVEDLHAMSDQAPRMIEVIKRDGERLAQVVPSGMTAADTILSVDLETYLLELNVGQLGGVNGLTRLASPGSKIDPHHRLIAAW